MWWGISQARRGWASFCRTSGLKAGHGLPVLLTWGPQWVDSSMILCLFTSASGLTKMSSTPVT